MDGDTGTGRTAAIWEIDLDETVGIKAYVIVRFRTVKQIDQARAKLALTREAAYVLGVIAGAILKNLTYETPIEHGDIDRAHAENADIFIRIVKALGLDPEHVGVTVASRNEQTHIIRTRNPPLTIEWTTQVVEDRVIGRVTAVTIPQARRVVFNRRKDIIQVDPHY